MLIQWSVQVVGYGMAVAKAQYAISEITAMLRAKGINVRVSCAGDVT
jgi:NAD/NADP transhydrogenase beta subunit